MPRIVLEPKLGRTAHAGLVQALAKELRHPSSKSMPYVLEESIAGTGLRTVTVIWDRWKPIREEERSDIILAAYESAEGENFAASIALPTGLTPTEAFALGYLRFKLEPARSENDAISAKEYHKAITVEGGTALLSQTPDVLRFARSEEAEAAKSRLQTSLPGSRWSLVEERSSD